jgi:hypothetical protein
VSEAARSTPAGAEAEAVWFDRLATVVATAAALFIKPTLHFVFDGGVLADGTPIRLQTSELDDYRFVDAGDLDRYLPAFIGARVTAALRGRGTGATVYLPWTGS